MAGTRTAPINSMAIAAWGIPLRWRSTQARTKKKAGNTMKMKGLVHGVRKVRPK